MERGCELRPGGGSGLGVGVRRGLAGASWIILQPEDPPSPSVVSWTMRIKLLLFLYSEKRQDDKDTVPPGSSGCGWELSWGEEGGKEGRSEEEEEGGGRRRQGVHHKINPFTVSSGCKVRYEADMSNETLQSSKGTAIKACIKLMELVISASIRRMESARLWWSKLKINQYQQKSTKSFHILQSQRSYGNHMTIFNLTYP